jgi:ABC-type transport system involved in cytochrome c biogenesis permease subunit
MALAGGAGILFLIQERRIKSKEPLTGFRRDLPALSVLDSVNGLSVLFGFPLYSLGILFGMVSARLAWGTLFSGDPKELISLLVWGLYAFLFRQRLAGGWRGRKPAILAVAVFAAALFSLFAVNTLMTTHHSFLAHSFPSSH